MVNIETLESDLPSETPQEQMAFEIHITVPDHSPAAQVIQHVSATRHISPEQAVTQLLAEAAKQHGTKSPGEEMIGLLSSDEDVALMDEVMEVVRERRKLDVPRDFGL